MGKNWYKKVSIQEQNSDRYDVLRAKYLLLGYSNLSDALDCYEYFLWVQKLKKYNKNARK